MGVSCRRWGAIDEQDIYLYTLRDELEVEITNYGATIVSVKAPDRNGVLGDVMLGFNELNGYLTSHNYHGATIGRYANRISGGFTLDDVYYPLPLNDGFNHLHGGFTGFDKHLWDVVVLDDNSIRLGRISPDGEEGYPGELWASVTFTLQDDILELDYIGQTDKPTIVNLTNHTYFNLGDSDSILDHHLWIDADHYTPIDNNLIPIGKTEPVTSTPFDFRQETTIGSRIMKKDSQLQLGNGYDHNYVLNHITNPQVRLSDPKSGRVLEVSTTMPGVQLYSGNFLDGKEIGRDGPIEFRSGVCLETQHFPDSPNKPDFPSPILRPKEKYIEKTSYRFTVMN